MNKRNFAIDQLKVLAAFFVIAVHHLPHIRFLEIPLASPTMFISSMVYTILLTCVPLFFLITGFLLNKRKLDRHHYFKIIPFLIESFLILLVCGIVNAEATPLQFILQPPYYVTYYLLVYLMIPFLNQITSSLNKNQAEIMLISFALLMALPTTLNNFASVSIDSFASSLYPVFYYLMGTILKKFSFKIKKAVGFWLVLSATILNELIS